MNFLISILATIAAIMLSIIVIALMFGPPRDCKEGTVAALHIPKTGWVCVPGYKPMRE